MLAKHINLYKPSYVVARRTPEGKYEFLSGLYFTKKAAKKDLFKQLDLRYKTNTKAYIETNLQMLKEGYTKPFLLTIKLTAEEECIYL